MEIAIAPKSHKLMTISRNQAMQEVGTLPLLLLLLLV